MSQKHFLTAFLLLFLTVKNDAMSYSNSKKEINFFGTFEKFIKDSRTGRRLQPNGKKVSPGTITNYHFTLRLLRRFCETKDFNLRLKQRKRTNKLEIEREQRYWK
jgi:hypothetical protein